MKNTIKVVVGIGLALSLAFLPFISGEHSKFFYWWFAGAYLYLYWIIKKYRELIGFITFLSLGLSLIVSILNLNEAAKVISIFSFIGVISFLLFEYITRKNE